MANPVDVARMCKAKFQEILDPFTSSVRVVDRETTIACGACFDGMHFPHCCCQITLTMTFEAVLIADALVTRGHSLFQKLAVHGEQQMQVFGGDVTLAAFDYRLADQWMEKQVPCPLLVEETNRCLLYDLRPASCSTYWVHGDREQCGPPYNRMRTIPTVNNLEMLASLLVIDAAFCERFGINNVPLPLGIAVKKADSLIIGYKLRGV